MRSLVGEDFGACEFCGRSISINHEECGVLHELPTCPTFDHMGVIEYLAAIRKARERKATRA